MPERRKRKPRGLDAPGSSLSQSESQTQSQSQAVPGRVSDDDDYELQERRSKQPRLLSDGSDRDGDGDGDVMDESLETQTVVDPGGVVAGQTASLSELQDAHGNNDEIENEFRTVDGGNELSDSQSQSQSESESEVRSRPRPINKKGKAAEAGIIKQVHVENFMCHRSMTINLCRNVNFIHGQNGSGKSAVLAALQICLGAGARRTNRARNLRELVRHEAGPHCVAKVRVTLWNEGDDGFEPDVYGDTIMIERHIPKSGSGYNGYKLLDAQGQEKSRSKQELDRLLDHLNIQVENPVAVLDQEEAKKFLTGKPEDKYKFFCKATELERMDRTYLNVVEHMQELSTKQQHLEKKVQPSLDQVKRLKHEWQRFEQLDKLEEKKLDLEAMYAWARFHDYEREAQKVYEDLQQVYARRDKRLAELTQAEELTCTQDEEQRLQERINDLSTEAEKGRDDKCRLEQEAQQLAGPIRKKERERIAWEKEMSRAQKARDDAQKALNEERERITSGKAKSDAARRTEQLQVAERKLVELNKKHDENRQLATQRQHEYEELEPALEHARNQAQSLQRQVRGVRYKVQELQKHDGGNKLAQFGSKCPAVWTAVQRAIQRGEFRGPVVGPIGNSLKMVAGKEMFASLVEFVMSSTVLDRFIVTNDHDRKLYQQIRVSARCSARECGVFQMHPSAAERRYDIPQPPEGIDTLATCLEIEEPLVFNCLVDNVRIDGRALAESKEAGEQALLVRDGNSGRERMAVGFIKEVYSLPSGDHWKIMNGARAMVSNERRLRRATIGVDQKAAREEAEAELENLQEECGVAEKEASAMGEKMRSIQIDWNEAKRAQRELVREKQHEESEISRLRAEADTSADVEADTTELEEDVGKAEAEVCEIQQRIRDCELEVESLHPALSEKKKELEEVTARNKKILADMEQAHQAMVSFLQTKDQRSAILEKKKKKVRMIQETVGAFERNVREKEEDRDKCLHAARVLQFRRNVKAHQEESRSESLGDGAKDQDQQEQEDDDVRRTPEIGEEPTESDLEAIEAVEVSRSAEYYENTIRRLQDKIERRRNEMSDMSPEQAYEQYLRAKKDAESKTSMLAKLDSNVRAMGDDIMARRRRWKVFRRYLVKATNRGFDDFLAMKGSAGELKFNHKEGTLDLVVQKDENDEESQTNDVKALSGGERSYTTLSLLMALGERLETPFRVMDEFDVFLDPVSRRLALNTLVKIAKAMSHRQFIFITPQDLSTLTPGPDLRIHKMRPPARSATAQQQQTLD